MQNVASNAAFFLADSNAIKYVERLYVLQYCCKSLAIQKGLYMFCRTVVSDHCDCLLTLNLRSVLLLLLQSFYADACCGVAGRLTMACIHTLCDESVLSFNEHIKYFYVSICHIIYYFAEMLQKTMLK